ncbi:hypothetical protein ACGFH8_10500 [Micromonospora sp. NPDC049175]|uniref:hypothetical protein n=1 Tax=Micromonospora sp. NPDC049175 TaxID=3364266 RepID=UPI0037166F23
MSGDRPSPLVIERILRDREGIWQQIVAERDLNKLTGRMLASSAIALACYGAVLGFFHSPLMALTSALKLPLLFLVTLTICLPTLYLFNLVFGARLSVRQSLALVMVAITVTSMLAVAFAPISLFFLITANDYGFFKLLNVAILALSALVGLRFLTSGMQVLNDNGLLAPSPANAQVNAPANAPAPAVPAAVPAASTPAAAPVAGASAEPAAAPTAVAVAEPTPNGATAAPAHVPAQWSGQPAGAASTLPPGYPPSWNDRSLRRGEPTQRPASMTLLYIWILLFGFVGTQLAWTLRPFFGDPGQDFAFFRSIDGNFYAEILRTIANL